MIAVRVSDLHIVEEIDITYMLSRDDRGDSVRLGSCVGNRNHVHAEPRR